MDIEELLGKYLNPHRCVAESCENSIDGVLSFCPVHWGLLTATERDVYTGKWFKLARTQSADDRGQFYQSVQWLIERLRNREGKSNDNNHYVCLP